MTDESQKVFTFHRGLDRSYDFNRRSFVLRGKSSRDNRRKAKTSPKSRNDPLSKTTQPSRSSTSEVHEQAIQTLFFASNVGARGLDQGFACGPTDEYLLFHCKSDWPGFINTQGTDMLASSLLGTMAVRLENI
jgi:hypothetical protein